MVFTGMSFCYRGLAQLFDFGFLPLKINRLKKQKQCAASVPGTKSMTVKTTEGLARGVGKRAMHAGTVEFYQCGVLPANVNLQIKSSIKRKKMLFLRALEVL